jgi:hypothetical protein
VQKESTEPLNEKIHTSLFKDIALFFCKCIETNQSVELNQIFALKKRFKAAVINEACSQLRMLEYISNIFISKCVIDRNRCQSIKGCCNIGNCPLNSIFGENSEQFNFFSFGLTKKFLNHNTTTYLLSLLNCSIICNVIYFSAILSFDNSAYINNLVPSAGR